MTPRRFVPLALLLVALAAAVPLGVRAQAPASADLPFRNPALPVEQRIDDLVGRLTLDEKVSLMVERAAPVERLGIPKFPWWNEALHGVARAGRATVFPQAIALASTWDGDLVLRVATAISDEAPRDEQHVGEARQAQPLPGARVLVAEHQHLPRPALGPRPGDLRRGPVPHRHDRHRLREGHAGQRPALPQDGGDRQALRGPQRPRVHATHGRREGERDRPPRDVPAGVPRAGGRREGRVGDVRLQLDPRPAGLRQRRAARQDPPRPVGLPGLRRVRLRRGRSTSTKATRRARPRRRAPRWRSSPAPTSSAAPARGRRASRTPSCSSARR